jgi:hypothetical protein
MPICTRVLRRGSQSTSLSVVGGVMLRRNTVALGQVMPMG